MFLKDYTFTWWQIGIFKVGLLSAGVLLGIYFIPFFKKYKKVLWVLAVLSLLYVTFISFT